MGSKEDVENTDDGVDELTEEVVEERQEMRRARGKCRWDCDKRGGWARGKGKGKERNGVKTGGSRERRAEWKRREGAEGRAMKVRFVNVRGLTVEGIVETLMVAEEKGWDIVGCGEIWNGSGDAEEWRRRDGGGG